VSERFANPLHGSIESFIGMKFADVIVSHDPLAQAVSHSARTSVHEIILALL
jgi:hypothetical protein